MSRIGKRAEAALENQPPLDEDRLCPGVGAYWGAAFAGAALVVLALVLGLSAFWLDGEREQAQRHVTSKGQDLARGLASRVSAVRGQLDRWRDDAGIQVALADGRQAVLRAKEEELSVLFPGALGVGLFQANDMTSNGDASQRLSFAGLDMVRAVAGDAQVAALEAHRVNRKDEHLAIAAPILRPGGDGVLGVVHVKLPMSMVPRIGNGQRGQARFLFQQKVGDEMVPLRADAEPVPERAPDFREPVAGTRVEVWGWSEAQGLFARERLPWLGAFYAAALLGLALALWLPRRALKRALSADLDALTATVADAVAKRPPRMVRNRLAELQSTQEQVRRQLRDLTPARVVQPRPAPDLAALAGELDSEETRELELDFGDGLAVDDALDLPADGGAGADAPRDEAVDEAEPVDAGVDRMPTLSDAIFRAYDIRGLIDTELDADVMLALGRALGSESIARDSTTVVVGRDQRPSSQALAQALVTGLRQTGVDVIDLGIAPTPLVYFACGLRPGTSAAIVTASHNPAAYNGLKMVLAGVSATTDDIAVLRRRIHGGVFETGSGDYREESILDAYVEAVERDIAIARGLSLVIDCGHATASLVAPALFRALGCDVIELDCDCDPTLADAHMPDPAQPRNLYALGDAVRNAGADLGLAFDADGDRLGIVDNAGHAIPADRVLMLLAADLLARQPGSDIVYDVKCSHHLGAEILRHGGRPVMWKSGHTHLKQKLRECGAPLAGEYTGHYMFAERWSGFDDGFYAAGRLLEVLALDPRPSSEVFAELPSGPSTPELFVPLPAAETRGVMEAVLGMADRLDGVDVNTIDGLRADFDQGWGLVRASNTQNGLTFRFEADDKASLDKIQDLFRRMMDLAAPRLQLPF